MSKTHIIGAGMAGLSAAVELTKLGHKVCLYEAAPQAGGRCRSFYDNKLDCEIDNGNHLLLSGNTSAMNYLKTIGAEDELIGPDAAIFPFFDVNCQKRWDIEFNNSRIPFWLLSKSARVPEASFGQHLTLAKILGAKDHHVIADFIDTDNPLYERLIDPLSVAVINMPPETASAKLMANVLKETVMKGGRACRPRIAKHSLAKTFVDPAINYLTSQSVHITYGARLKSVTHENERVKVLNFINNQINVDNHDTVIMALSPEPTGEVLDFITAPKDYSSIVNAHFRLNAPIKTDWAAPLIGLIGSTSQWVFIRGNIASITISAGDAYLGIKADDLTKTLWAEIAPLLGQDAHKIPPSRIIKEKRATLAQNPALEPLRPKSVTPYRNLFLAGDWTNTALPATIEGAIRSGVTAAKHVSCEPVCS
ncbi:MAG: hydroxysqualene dehydroxylase HpnE [Litorimonas sp.]